MSRFFLTISLTAKRPGLTQIPFPVLLFNFRVTCLREFKFSFLQIRVRKRHTQDKHNWKPNVSILRGLAQSIEHEVACYALLRKLTQLRAKKLRDTNTRYHTQASSKCGFYNEQQWSTLGASVCTKHKTLHAQICYY